MNFLQSLAQQFTGKPIDWDELEEALIRADLGVPMTMRIIKTLQEREAWALLGIGDVIKAVREEIARILPPRPTPIHRANAKPTVILIVGVNGTGKTTSTAKLAHYLLGRGGSPEPPAGDLFRPPQVMLAAADTFRAAAIEQLDVWAKRLGVEMIRGQYGADSDAPHETLLVVDATTGGNALNQAREFHSVLTITGLIVTKLDGSGKGGIVVAIQDEFGIPTRFVGTGERLDDFALFSRDMYIANLL